MTSQAQINANRRNAVKSTGPTSEAGKRRARMNSLKHGAFLAGNDAVAATLLKEDFLDLQELHTALIDDLAPASTLQYALAEHIAQLLINQLRVGKLTTALIDGEALDQDEVATIGQDHVRREYWQQLGHAIGSRHREVDLGLDFDIPYLYLAGVEYARLKDPSVPPPHIDPNVEDPWVAARRELFRIVEAIYGSLDAAFDDVRQRISSLNHSAEAEERRIRAVEARRLIGTFEKVTALSDRVARSIARSLKEYRALKEMETSLVEEVDVGDDRDEPAG